jgi:hypothetical protein
MDDVYTYDHVKEYWDRFYPTVESAEDEPRRLVNPGEDGATVRVPEYLAWLDDRAIREVPNHPCRVLPGRERYPRAAMFRATAWGRIVGERSLLWFHRLLEDCPYAAMVSAHVVAMVRSSTALSTTCSRSPTSCDWTTNRDIVNVTCQVVGCGFQWIRGWIGNAPSSGP